MSIEPRTQALSEAQGPTTHVHKPEHPSRCTGCEHLAADLARRLPEGLLPRSEAQGQDGLPLGIRIDTTAGHNANTCKSCQLALRQALSDTARKEGD